MIHRLSQIRITISEEKLRSVCYVAQREIFRAGMVARNGVCSILNVLLLGVHRQLMHASQHLTLTFLLSNVFSVYDSKRGNRGQTESTCHMPFGTYSFFVFIEKL